jgi:phosphoglycerate kinase
MPFRTLDDAGTIYGQTALVRVDFNVPMEGGRVTDDTRLRSALPTIKRLQAGGAKVALLAHFERPKGKRVPEMSLRPVVEPLAALLGRPVAFADDCVGPDAQRAVGALPHEGVVLLENVRFHPGEESNDAGFAAQLAELADFYVNDAFSAAHRAHASTEAIARVLPAYAGEALRRELTMLDKALGTPERPVMGIVGGSKVSTKLDLLNNLVGKLDRLAIGGGMANTFLSPMATTSRPPGRARHGGDGAEHHPPPRGVSAASCCLRGRGVSDRGAGAPPRCGRGEVRPEDKILDAGPENPAPDQGP